MLHFSFPLSCFFELSLQTGYGAFKVLDVIALFKVHSGVIILDQSHRTDISLTRRTGKLIYVVGVRKIEIQSAFSVRLVNSWRRRLFIWGAVWVAPWLGDSQVLASSWLIPSNLTPVVWARTSSIVVTATEIRVSIRASFLRSLASVRMYGILGFLCWVDIDLFVVIVIFSLFLFVALIAFLGSSLIGFLLVFGSLLLKLHYKVKLKCYFFFLPVQLRVDWLSERPASCLWKPDFWFSDLFSLYEVGDLQRFGDVFHLKAYRLGKRLS